MLKLRPRMTQPVEKSRFDADDEEMALADKLASTDSPLPVDDDQIPTLPAMPKSTCQAKPKPRPAVNAQQLLDMVVTAVLNETCGIIKQDGNVYLTILEQKDNTVLLRTIGTLRLGGVTVIRGSSITK